jgi:V8-like Glu-specific endopeptidase
MAQVYQLPASQWPWVGFVRSFFPALAGRQLPFAVGTGSLIQQRLVLTAGHVVFDREYGGAPLAVDVTLPGQGTFPGRAVPTDQWRDQDSLAASPVSAFDFAAIFLDSPVTTTEPVGVGLGEDLLRAQVTVVGYTGQNYPNVPFYGASAFPMPSPYDAFRIAYPIDTLDGMSGGPVYTLDAANRPTIRGVHTSFYNGHGDALRVTPNVLNLINTWLGSA